MEWRQLRDTTYYISNTGEVRNKDGIHLSKKMRNGYLSVAIYTNKKIQLNIHRILAETFIDNPHNYPMVDHINNNKLDNRIENLRWCDSSLNNRNRKANNNTGKKYITFNEKMISKPYRLNFNNVNGLSFSCYYKTIDEAVQIRNNLIQIHNITWRDDYDVI
jgi:hypothetical protein